MLVALVVLGAAGVCAAGTDPVARHDGLHTGSLLFTDPGSMVISLGVEYLPDVTNDLAGVRGELARIPTLGVRLGLADNAEFQLSWPAYNWLHVHSQVEPPVLGRQLGGSSTDWGDLTVATVIQLQAAHGRWPGYGLRFAAKLPNSNEKLGIGDNTTDVFASGLVSSNPASRLSLFGDLGLGILTERTRAFTQNDVLTYGGLADWRVNGTLRVIGEVAGQATTHTPGPGTGSRSEARAGFELSKGLLHGSALLVHGLIGDNSRGIGVSVNVSTRFSLLRRAAPPR